MCTIAIRYEAGCSPRIVIRGIQVENRECWKAFFSPRGVSSRKWRYVHRPNNTFYRNVKNLHFYLLDQTNQLKTILDYYITQATSNHNGWVLPRFLSRVLVNWLSAGGTFKRCLRILFFLWIRTTLGHLTNRCRSLLGGKAPPIPNCLVRFSNSGFTTFSWNIN